MSNDPIKQFVALRERLVKEKAEIEARLGEINTVLGGMKSIEQPRKEPRATPVHRIPNPMSLREAVLKVTAKKALTKQEILDEVQKLGYRFGGGNPMNSLGVLLYGKKPKFKNIDGRFSVA